MEIAKVSFDVTGTDQRQILLREQGLVAYDISLIHYTLQPQGSPFDSIDLMQVGLSRREQDQREDEETPIIGGDMGQSQAIFGVVSFFAQMITSGLSAGFIAHTIAFPKPYTVPFAAAVINAVSNVSLNIIVEVYYDEVTVTSRKMAWLRRRTEVIRTS